MAPVSKLGHFFVRLFQEQIVSSFVWLLMRGAIIVAPLLDHYPRSSYELDNVPWSKAVVCRSARTKIGQKLKALDQVPQDLPQEMLTLLIQLNAWHEEE